MHTEMENFTYHSRLNNTDVPAWLRSLRLHKYNPIFETMKWQDMLKMDDEALLGKGVAALGARRKLLKVFDQVKAHCQANVSPLSQPSCCMLSNLHSLLFRLVEYYLLIIFTYVLFLFLFISPHHYILQKITIP